MVDLATIPDYGLEEIERQNTLQVNHRTPGRRGCTNWGLPPNIARASASREKPQQPAVVSKPAPVEVVTLASLPPGTIFRIVTDYESLKEAFADRIEDLAVPLTEIDAVSGMTRGNMQKLLSDSDQKWAREFGWKSLNKALTGTGMALVFVIDDEKFAPIKAQMAQRKLKQKRQFKLLAPPSPPAADGN